ncbi:nucleoporin complex subunit 54-domain-containing protein [Parasitella parasitica]|nr:nucleoporin complex subunit 54-domain-containing protein [Parasitella parasitica]
MSFVFSTPTPANSSLGGGFGSSQTPAASTAFGQPATTAATTAFGTQQQPSAFGAGFGTAASTAPAASGFGRFGSTAPTTPATSFGGFGSAASTAPATSFGGFGSASSSTAPATSFGGFGSASSAAPATSFGGFGSAASTTPATSFGFGTTGTTQAPAAANTFAGFGATTTSAPNTGLFGSTANTSTGFGGFGTNKPALSLSTTTNTGTAGGGSLFGFGNNSTMAGAGGFGSQQQANMARQREQQVYQLLSQIDQDARAQATPAINSEDYKPENVWHSLALLKSWWDPKSPSCRFQHYFYNVVSPQEAHLYQKPADHDQAAWDAAQAANPDPTTRVPALAIGFDDVQKRMDEQHKLSEAHSAKLAEIQAMIKEIQKKSQLETGVKLDEYKRKHMKATQRVIKFLKYAQVLRNKGLSITPDEEVMRARLENIQDQLQRSEQFHGKLSQLWAQLQLIKEQGRQYSKIDGVDGWEAVSEENINGITKTLDEQNNGIQHIIEVLETDTGEVDNIHKGWRTIQ